jgi:group I intron endonuclease
MSSTGTIYVIKNVVNNKKYIGLTRRDVNERFNEHLRKAFQEDSPAYKFPLSKEIREHNIEAFKLGILNKDVPDKDLEIVEAHYIDLYNTLDPNVGLNLSPSSSVTRGYETEELTAEDNKDTTKKIKIDEIEDSEIEKLLNNWND